jgi:hypothetical protein
MHICKVQLFKAWLSLYKPFCVNSVCIGSVHFSYHYTLKCYLKMLSISNLNQKPTLQNMRSIVLKNITNYLPNDYGSFYFY